ncbi:MAG: hypothetical protein FHK80_18990 [Azoarcus sp. PHD]|nr:MAG: hypothetical protein FHK80_18990 [Azoarcus sp. PHD]
MLTPEEVERLEQLIDRRRPPEDGMEAHFLRVMDGGAMPCTPKEHSWCLYWQQGRVKTPAIHQPIDELERMHSMLLEKHRLELEEKNKTIEALTKENSRLETWLKNAHKALANYEPLPPPLVTDTQGDNERKMRHAEIKLSQLLTKGNYSSTDGQD